MKTFPNEKWITLTKNVRGVRIAYAQMLVFRISGTKQYCTVPGATQFRNI